MGDEKNLYPGDRKFILINLFEFLKESWHLKNYFNSNFLSWKTRRSTFYFPKSKNRQFVRINLLLENGLNGKFYCPNVFHYGFKIQSLTWTIHCRSQNLESDSTSLKNEWIWLLKNRNILLVLAWRENLYSYQGASFLIWDDLTWPLVTGPVFLLREMSINLKKTDFHF